MMRMLRLLTILAVVGTPLPAAAAECIVVLHGLSPVFTKMHKMASSLEQAGYLVANITYPSRSDRIENLAADAVGRGVAQCRDQQARLLHFVGHSLGGILLRVYFARHEMPDLGRVVMLGTPNQGTRMVDRLRWLPGFGLLGPAAQALGTEQESIVHRLEPVNFELGVIAGRRNLNPLALLLLEGPNDGLVSVASTRVPGMQAHITLPVMHNFMIRNNRVIEQTIHFLQTGTFLPE